MTWWTSLDTLVYSCRSYYQPIQYGYPFHKSSLLPKSCDFHEICSTIWFAFLDQKGKGQKTETKNSVMNEGREMMVGWGPPRDGISSNASAPSTSNGGAPNSSLVFTLPISCQICLSKVKEPVICSNRHVFCKICMDVWLLRNNQCPACRITIDEGIFYCSYITNWPTYRCSFVENLAHLVGGWLGAIGMSWGFVNERGTHDKLNLTWYVGCPGIAWIFYNNH